MNFIRNFILIETTLSIRIIGRAIVLLEQVFWGLLKLWVLRNLKTFVSFRKKAAMVKICGLRKMLYLKYMNYSDLAASQNPNAAKKTTLD